MGNGQGTRQLSYTDTFESDFSSHGHGRVTWGAGASNLRKTPYNIRKGRGKGREEGGGGGGGASGGGVRGAADNKRKDRELNQRKKKVTLYTAFESDCRQKNLHYSKTVHFSPDR